MAIYRILQNAPFGPEEVSQLAVAYEETLEALGLTDRNDPIVELVAKKLIEIYQRGIHDPLQLSKATVKELSPSP